MQGRTLQEMLPHVLSCSDPGNHSALRLEGSSVAGVRITGFITAPHAALPSRAEQYTYVNRRFVHRCEQVSKLVESLHSQAQPSERSGRGPGPTSGRGDTPAQRGACRSYPAFVLFIDCPPAMVEVLSGADSTQALCADWGPVLDATRAALLTAWKQYMPDRMLRGPAQHSTARPPHSTALAPHSTARVPHSTAQHGARNMHSTGVSDAIRTDGERGRWHSEPARAAQRDWAAGPAMISGGGLPETRAGTAAQAGGGPARAGAGPLFSVPQMARFCSPKTL